MGQNVSQPQGGSLGAPQQPQMEERPRRRGASFGALILDATSSSADSTTTDDAGRLLHDHAGSNTTSTRSTSRNRFSQLLPSFSNTNSDASLVHASPHRSALRRSRTTFTNLFRRHPFHQTQQSRASAILQNRSSYMRAAELDTADENEVEAPRLPSIDHSSSFLERDIFPVGNTSSNDVASNTSQPGRTASSLFDMRRNGAHLRRLGSALRRRRSPPPGMRRGAHGEDQAVLLSQLLSAAAAATAATLMGDDHQALNEARSLSVGTEIGDLGGSGEDGSFEGFLRALQSGRIASALRQSGEAADGTEVSTNGSLNFFRMFRFGSVAPDAPSTESPAAEGRMIPIIIVGIRSISPSSGPDSSPSNDLPPFLDALTSLASSAQDTEEMEGLGQDSIDSILRPARNSTSFRHRRRASIGAFGSNRRRVTDYYDELRDQRMPERRRERPWSVASSLSNELRPPPATPASPSPELSRISSRNSTPAHSRPASFIANSIRELTGESRRNSALHRSVSSPLAIHTEETVSVHSARSSDNLLRHSSSDHRWDSTHRQPETPAHTHYPRFASGHPRRNGMVGPDDIPSHARPATSSAGRNSDGNTRNDSRSWIIYVLGGSYPENHPILTTPSLFSDNPTYEDMMLLSALLGPAKAPVASQEDVQNAGGTYTVIAPIDAMTDDHKVGELVALATEDTNLDSNPARVALEAEHRCLVCLSDFQVEEVLRRLGKCGHLFHKDCIDHWLTQGRNSCPLCRGEGVEEKSKSDPPDQVPNQVSVDA